MAGPSPTMLRGLAAAGALLVVAGALVGWFERSAAADVDPVVDVVRVDDVLGLGVLGPLALLPVLVAPLLVRARRAAAFGLLAAVPALALVVTAAALRPRVAVSGETIGEVVSERPLGQGLSLVGILVVVMALGAAWRSAPDWRIPMTWSTDAPERPTVTGP